MARSFLALLGHERKGSEGTYVEQSRRRERVIERHVVGRHVDGERRSVCLLSTNEKKYSSSLFLFSLFSRDFPCQLLCWPLPPRGLPCWRPRLRRRHLLLRDVLLALALPASSTPLLLLLGGELRGLSTSPSPLRPMKTKYRRHRSKTPLPLLEFRPWRA